MKVGTPGFVGERLREAREARGLSAVTLSELTGISQQAISQYQTGQASPGREALRLIATAVNLPEHFFTLAPREMDNGAVFYRSMSSATKGARARAERRFTWLRDIVNYLSQFVELPAANLPDLRLPSDPLLLSNDDVENAAEEVRRYWGLRDAPIANMVLLLENQGVVLARDALGAESLDSLSTFATSEQRPYIVLGTDKGTPVRWRFDAAHELGHVVLHKNLDYNRLSRPEHFKMIEQQAHRFAAAFLLPLGAFEDDLFGANLDNFSSLKLKWKTSIAMMIMRVSQANLISETSQQRLWINYSRRGWKRSEPYDETMDIEEPRLLRRSFELVLSHGAQTPEDVVSSLALTATDIETLSGLTNGFLSDFARVELRQDIGTRAFTEAKERQAEVIPLGFRRRTT